MNYDQSKNQKQQVAISSCLGEMGLDNFGCLPHITDDLGNSSDSTESDKE